ETTPLGAFVRDYKIQIEVQINSEQEFMRWYSKNSPYWEFQEHAILSVTNVPAGTAFRKNIRDPARGRVLTINGLVQPNNFYNEDVETAKRIIESIKLIPITGDRQ